MALGERMKAFWGPRVPRREREGSRKSASQRRAAKSSKKQFRHVSIIGGDNDNIAIARSLWRFKVYNNTYKAEGRAPLAHS